MILPQKRKADDRIVTLNETKSEDKPNPFAFLNKNKKSKSVVNTKSKNDNPFKLLKKNCRASQVSGENPFKMSPGKKRRETDDISDLAISKKKKEHDKDRIFSSTVNDSSNKSGNSSKISKTIATDINTIWMSKKSLSNNENIENNYDTEMQKFVDQFKDTVVVEYMANLTIRRSICKDEINGKVSKGKHNYKKFKKVMPLRPQKTIITRDNFIAYGSRDVTGIADSRRDFHLSDDETDGNIKAKKKPPKRFFI